RRELFPLRARPGAGVPGRRRAGRGAPRGLLQAGQRAQPRGVRGREAAPRPGGPERVRRRGTVLDVPRGGAEVLGRHPPRAGLRDPRARAQAVQPGLRVLPRHRLRQARGEHRHPRRRARGGAVRKLSWAWLPARGEPDGQDPDPTCPGPGDVRERLSSSAPRRGRLAGKRRLAEDPRPWARALTSAGRLGGGSAACHAVAVAPSLRPFWFAAVFLAGGGVGAAGVHLLIESTPDELGAKAAGQARQPQGGDLPAEEPTGADTGRTQVDREALRAALAELLAEERRSVPAEIAEEEEPDPAEGMSAAEALARLEAAYRAELAARERLARAHEEESPEEGVVAEQAADERAVAERTFAEASVEDPRERELLEAPARGVRAMREREDPEQDVESGPRLARAERARGRSAAEPPTHLQGDPA